jgi:ribosome recycling factor
MIDELINTMREKMRDTIEAFARELKVLRTGRASIALLDNIKVEYYGSLTPLNQVSSLSSPEPQLLIIQPWDNSIIRSIEKAIQKSDLGITPSSDGKVIRLSIPPLTEERRRELIKKVKKMAENHKTTVRNDRRDANDAVKSMQKTGSISEDEAKKATHRIQEITDKYIKKTDEIFSKKEEEIMEV